MPHPTGSFLASLRLMPLLILLSASVGAAESRIQQPVNPPPVRGAATYRFLLSLPRDYDQSPEQRWPLLLFLHGAGHKGSDLWRLITLGPPKLIENGPSLSDAERAAASELTTRFIVVSPQCLPGDGWEEHRLLALLDHVEKSYRIDRARVYVTGASMGGHGAWMLAVRHPDRIAAVAAVCGGGFERDVLKARGRTRDRLRRLGVWAFHNDGDPTVPLQASERMIDAFHAIGAADVRFTIYPSTRHDAWTRAFSDLALYAWLLEHRAGATP